MARYVIQKTFKGANIGTTGVVYESIERAEKACAIHNEAKAKFSNALNYRVIKIGD